MNMLVFHVRPETCSALVILGLACGCPHKRTVCCEHILVRPLGLEQGGNISPSTFQVGTISHTCWFRGMVYLRDIKCQSSQQTHPLACIKTTGANTGLPCSAKIPPVAAVAPLAMAVAPLAMTVARACTGQRSVCHELPFLR